MVALVEAIAGRERAAQLAARIGLTHWDARHRSADFTLTLERAKSFVRNTLAFWRRERVGLPVAAGVDEIALGLTADAYGRTAMTRVAPVAEAAGVVSGRRGLKLRLDPPAASGVDVMLPPPDSEQPAATLDHVLPRIAGRYGRPTADIVALALEYPWRGPEAGPHPPL